MRTMFIVGGVLASAGLGPLLLFSGLVLIAVFVIGIGACTVKVAVYEDD